ncbi:response regulator [Melioribacter roseus P3M-2]|uniref:Response regulator n=1 Tax=Melioribacter roseus (strain DSM 23840 / JCM 17771 / VKM B-2668 / P3M-2) TaxID=1191523 RepID=I6ZUM1_MELRP|nr:response regulator [Melioribacter roseus]AFN75714.1 response regulator [Melioribacter roseus P3M-2]
MDVKKILLVDDDIDLLEQNKVLLESKGYKVVTAESGAEGWEAFQKENPDAAIIDLIMEEMDSGFILCHRIKKSNPNVPVFIVTSAPYTTGFKFSASTNEEKEWLKCDGILNKPIVIEELAAKLKNM